MGKEVVGLGRTYHDTNNNSSRKGKGGYFVIDVYCDNSHSTYVKRQGNRREKGGKDKKGG